MSDPILNAPPDALRSYMLRPAAPPLRDIVDHFWLARLDPATVSLVPWNLGEKVLGAFGPEGIAGADAPGFPHAYRHLMIVPDGALEILVHLPYRVARNSPADPDSGTAYGCVLFPVTHTMDIAYKIPSLMFGIRFFAGGAREFFPTSVHTLADCPIPLDDLWGASATELARDLAGPVEITELAAIAERHLLSRRSDPSGNTAIVRRCADALERSHGAMPIDELQEISGLAERQLQRLFKEHAGMSPKRLARILRLDYLLTAVRNLDAVDWHELVLTLDYCDQPHLIREFRDFVGMSPASFREHMKRHLESKRRLEERKRLDESRSPGSEG